MQILHSRAMCEMRWDSGQSLSPLAMRDVVLCARCAIRVVRRVRFEQESVTQIALREWEGTHSNIHEGDELVHSNIHEGDELDSLQYP